MAAVGTITWWGCAGVELHIDGRSLAVDPYLYPEEPRVQYICITHNDYDHCHEPTLEKLVNGGRFERLILPRACLVRSKLDSPTNGPSQDLAFVDPNRLTVMYPKYTREPDKQYPGPTELDVDGFHIETVDSSERPLRYRRDPEEVWPVGHGPFVGDAAFPNLGYVVTEESSGLTFYHPGDLGDAFDSLRQLREKIDFMFFPVPKLVGLEVTIIDAIRPKYVIPMHYRVATPDFPIPLHITQADLTQAVITNAMPKPGGDPDVWRREIHAMMDAHWYPTTDPPLERFESLIPELEALGSRVAILKAGKAYELANFESNLTRGLAPSSH